MHNPPSSSAAWRRVRRASAFSASQILVFGLCQYFDHPSYYALFIPLSVALGAAAARWDAFSTASATIGAVLIVVLGMPLLLFIARQSPSLVWQKALDPAVHRTLYLSIYAPLLAALASVALGVPLARNLARGFAGSAIVQSLVDLPLVVPHSVAGLMVLFAFGKGGVFPDLPVLGTLLGMVLAMIFVSAPYAVNAARQAFDAVPLRLEYAARIHGAGPWQTFWRVQMPLATRGIVVGGLLAWARSVSELGAVAIVAYSVSFFYPFSGHRVTTQHAPVFIYNTYLSQGLAEAGAVGVLLLAVSSLIFLLIRWLMGSRTQLPYLP